MQDFIPRFKAKNLDQAMHSVVGDCNGISCSDRFEIETGLFADALVAQMGSDVHTVLDYGCGMGRLAKAVLARNPKITVIGVDASEDELEQARIYVDSNRFIPTLPENLLGMADFAYCIYVLQHVPAIELRHAIERIHHNLRAGGLLAYCSSDYRMAINASGGFTDDAHLGVNIRREVSRLFEVEYPLGFATKTEQETHIIRSLVENYKNVPGGIPHPAILYRRRDNPVGSAYSVPGNDRSPYHEWPFPDAELGQLAPRAARPEAKEEPSGPKGAPAGNRGPTCLVLRNRLSPGDILVMTAAIRSLHKAYPGKFRVWVDSPCGEIFKNSPHVEAGPWPAEAWVIDMHYPLISDHQMRGFQHPGSGISGRHFSDGHRKFLEEQLEIEIPRTGLVPELYLDQNEKLWPFLLRETGHEGPYWVINAGSKKDFPLKQYHRYQEVVDRLEGRVTFVQIGVMEHSHPALRGVIDMRGKTDHRQLYRLIYQAEGVLTCVSYPMHIAAAFGKPCVVVAGGREGTRWELYPNHRFLNTNGALQCCAYDGCWKSTLEDCVNRVPLRDEFRVPEGEAYEVRETTVVPKCMELIKPQAIIDAIDMYYEGGILKREVAHV